MSKNQSIISAVVAFIFALITLLQSFGVHIPVIDENQLTTIVTGVITVIVWAWSIWKNHNFTNAAITGQSVVTDLKNGVSLEEIAERLSTLEAAKEAEAEAETKTEEAAEVEEAAEEVVEELQKPESEDK